MYLNFEQDNIYVLGQYMFSHTIKTELILHKTTGNDCLLTRASVLLGDKLLIDILIPFGQP